MIENMSGGVFGEGTIKKIAYDNNVAYLGEIKMNKDIAVSGDSGKTICICEFRILRII
jgi:hypothetical protein